LFGTIILGKRFVESFNVALYFAIREKENSHENGVIWLLNAHDLNEVRTKSTAIRVLGDSEENDYVTNFCHVREKGSGWTGLEIVAVLPPYTNPRILAQQGAFTLHENLELSLEELHERDISDRKVRKYLIKIEVPASMKNELGKMLELSAINEYFLFPDIEGLSKHLNEQYSYKISTRTSALPPIVTQ
jgi:hypothetical protein